MSEATMTDNVGNADKRRILAAVADNGIGIILSWVAVVVLSSDSPVLSGSTLCLTYLFYFLFFEAVLARTPGKMMTGLTIRKLDGRRCGFREALIRTGLRVFETNPLFFGGLPAGLAIMFSKRRQRLGDLAARTIVVSNKS